MGVPEQGNMAQMKEQNKIPKTELNDEEIANLLDAEFKTLIIRMLTELVEYGHKIKENVRGTNSEGKETETQINDLEQKAEINIWSEQNEEIRTQKNEERLRNLQDIFKCSNSRIIGVPGGKEEPQEIKNLLEK